MIDNVTLVVSKVIAIILQLHPMWLSQYDRVMIYGKTLTLHILAQLSNDTTTADIEKMK